MKMYIWSEYTIMMLYLCLTLVIGACNFVPNYGILTGELRVQEEDELG